MPAVIFGLRVEYLEEHIGIAVVEFVHQASNKLLFGLELLLPPKIYAWMESRHGSVQNNWVSGRNRYTDNANVQVCEH